MAYFESDLTEALFNKTFETQEHRRVEGAEFTFSMAFDGFNFVLDKDNAKIRVYNSEEEFEIRVIKTHKFKP